MNEDKRDRKITGVELAEHGLVISGREVLPPIKKKTQEALRWRREIPYSIIAGRVYYQASDLVEWAEAQKRGWKKRFSEK